MPKQSLAKVMALEADRMSGLRFDPDEVRLERNVIIEERRQRIELSPINLLNEQMAAALHLNHPYRAPVLGWAHEMSRLTREDAMAFYARHYAPNNALLVVQGDVEVGDVLRLAREAYGPIPPGQIVDPKARPRDPEPRAARRVELVDGRVTNASLFRSYFVAIDAGDNPAGEREALEILVRVLAQGDTSRLHKRLVERDRSAILTEGGTSTTRDGTRIALYAVAAIDEKLEPIEQAIEDEIRDVAERGIDEDELSRARAVIEAADVFDGDNQLTLALFYAEAIANGRSIADIEFEKRASGSGNERERPLGGSQASVARAIGHRSAAAAASGDRIATIRIGSSAMRRTPSAMGPSPSLSASLAVVLLTLAAASWCRPALASGIQRVTSTGGITAWLAEDHASPLLSLRFAFIGGSAAEPLRQGGVSRVLARLLLEGSDEPDFKMRVQRAGLRIGFQSGRDALFGSADLLTEHQSEAISLLAANLRRPRLDRATLDNARRLILADLAESNADPRTIASDRWYGLAFEDQAYGRPTGGAPEPIAGLTPGDVASFHAGTLTRDRLCVVAAGDIRPAELGHLLDAAFGALADASAQTPAKATLRSTSTATSQIKDYPAASIVFGLPAPPPSHPDHAVALVIAHVLGSGDFDLRLIGELRVRQGLVYSAQASLIHDRLASILMGDLNTSNENADHAVAALKSTLATFANEGPSEDELDAAKAAITGATWLSLDLSSRIADFALYSPGWTARTSIFLRSVTAASQR